MFKNINQDTLFLNFVSKKKRDQVMQIQNSEGFSVLGYAANKLGGPRAQIFRWLLSHYNKTKPQATARENGNRIYDANTANSISLTEDLLPPQPVTPISSSDEDDYYHNVTHTNNGGNRSSDDENPSHYEIYDNAEDAFENNRIYRK